MSVSSVRALPPATLNWTCQHPSSHDQWGPEITDDPELAYFRPFTLCGTNNHTDSDYPKHWTLNSLMNLNGAATRVVFSPPSFRLIDEALLALRTRSSASPLHSAGPPVGSLVLRVDEAEDVDDVDNADDVDETDDMDDMDDTDDVDKVVAG